MAEEQKKVKLTSNDGEEFFISKNVAKFSSFIRTQLDGEDSVIF